MLSFRHAEIVFLRFSLTLLDFSLACHSIFKVLSLALPSFKELVGSSGLEPPTSRLSGARSNRLSYEPILPGHLGVLFQLFAP